jgi:hypothetical protein
MNQTKVQFSASEMELMCNSEIILTKNKVLGKIKGLLEEVQNGWVENYKEHSDLYLESIFSIHPKISRGENYLGLPYLILDYPRNFKQEDIFAIRTMFWWGNFFSSTLHLSGKFKLQFVKKIEDAQTVLANEGFSIGVNPDPWLHHFGPDNYVPIALLNEEAFRKRCSDQLHLKISAKIPLNDKNLVERINKCWMLFVEICCN